MAASAVALTTRMSSTARAAFGGKLETERTGTSARTRRTKIPERAQSNGTHTRSNRCSNDVFSGLVCGAIPIELRLPGEGASERLFPAGGGPSGKSGAFR